MGLFKAKNLDGSFQSNILEGYTKEECDEVNGHCTIKPLSLMKRLVELFVPPTKENIVLDPFAGTGTTLLAAKEMGHPFVGIEIDEGYVKIAEQRLTGSGKKQLERQSLLL